MNNAEVLAMQGQRIEGFVKLEIVRKDGVKIIEEHNMITPAGKHYLLSKSAGKMLDMNGQVFGSLAKQGVEMSGTYGDNSSARPSASDYRKSLTNVILNLDEEQLNSINNYTNFINYFDKNLNITSKIVGYANSALNPLADGKEGTIDDIKGSEAIIMDCITRKFKYPDGVATGNINAIAMAPMTTITSLTGLSNNEITDRFAPGFTISKCLDKVNPQYVNFGSLSTSFLPPSVPGFTSETEVLYNYSQDGLNMHKIDLLTGEITNIEDVNKFLTLKDIYNSDIFDYYIEDNFIYLLRYDRDSIYFIAYDLSSKTTVKNISLDSGKYTKTVKFLKYNNELYVTVAHYIDGYNVLLKLSKGSNSYYSSVSETSASYEGILTLPSVFTNNSGVCFGNYGDKYVMYVSRALGTTNDFYYMTAYIFEDMNNIAGSIVDCIPSIYYYGEFLFKNSSVGGILSIGKNNNADDTTDGYNESVKYITSRDGNKKIDLRSSGLFYTPDKSWTNTMSIVKLDAPLTKGASDVLYVTYGYRIK